MISGITVPLASLKSLVVKVAFFIFRGSPSARAVAAIIAARSGQGGEQWTAAE